MTDRIEIAGLQIARELHDFVANEAGTDTAEIDVAHDIRASVVEGQRMFIEAHIVATAAGRPRIAA